MKNLVLPFLLINEFFAIGLEIIWEDLACLICRDDTKLRRQLTKPIILAALNPEENERGRLSLLVVNFVQIHFSHLFKSVVCRQELEDVQDVSSLHLPIYSVA